MPLRAEFATPSEPAETEGRLRVLVLGGSQGARQLNELLPPTVERLVARDPDLQVTHQVGAALEDEVRTAYERQGLGGIDLALVPFLDDVRAALCRAHLVVSRAGAITLAEICAVGRASLLVPLALAGAHQSVNARRLVEAGGAEMLGPDEATRETFAETVLRMTESRQRLRQMGEAARQLARPRAAAEVADLIEMAVRGT